MRMTIPFDNSYARLPASFHAAIAPSPVSAPRLLKLNRPLAHELGIDVDRLDSPEGAEILSGGRHPEGSAPIAMAYAGHQFGQFVPQLGDGRALLLGEVIDRQGRRRDIQLKGSGPTPFSRRGDGRAALGPVIREYLVSEAMHALRIPTTRALAMVATGESVIREQELPGAVLTRVAASHIRVGTFQFFAARGDEASLRQLADHAIARHEPEAVGAADVYRLFLEGVARRQAQLVARWMLVGFVHGVMNTDNMAVSGETIDYGPCAFMDRYDPATVFSSIDRTGRYAYANQPAIAQWNLARLAECLLPLLSEKEEEAIAQATAALTLYADVFNAAYLDGLRDKLGLSSKEDGDKALADDLLERMRAGQADFTNTFRLLGGAAADPGADAAVAAEFVDPASFRDWSVRWRERLRRDGLDEAERARAMDLVNPAFIPRNHRVEAVIRAAIEEDDYAPFETMLAVLAKPYDDQPEHSAFALPGPTDVAYRTFCGT